MCHNGTEVGVSPPEPLKDAQETVGADVTPTQETEPWGYLGRTQACHKAILSTTAHPNSVKQTYIQVEAITSLCNF